MWSVFTTGHPAFWFGGGIPALIGPPVHLNSTLETGPRSTALLLPLSGAPNPRGCRGFLGGGLCLPAGGLSARGHGCHWPGKHVSGDLCWHRRVAGGNPHPRTWCLRPRGWELRAEEDPQPPVAAAPGHHCKGFPGSQRGYRCTHPQHRRCHNGFPTIRGT